MSVPVSTGTSPPVGVLGIRVCGQYNSANKETSHACHYSHHLCDRCACALRLAQHGRQARVADSRGLSSCLPPQDRSDSLRVRGQSGPSPQRLRRRQAGRNRGVSQCYQARVSRPVRRDCGCNRRYRRYVHPCRDSRLRHGYIDQPGRSLRCWDGTQAHRGTCCARQR